MSAKFLWVAGRTKNMSRIFNCVHEGTCKPWQAPSFEAVEDSCVDYKLPESINLSNQQKQDIVRQQAYEKSYARGYMEGLQQGQKEIRQQVEYLQSIMATLAMPLPGVDDQVVHEMAELCMAVVRQMVRRELKTSPDEIVAVVKEAVGMLPLSSGEIHLELHPEDAALVRHALGEPGNATNWRIVEDPLLTRGGCRVQTRVSRIDATVETRLNATIAAVMGGERQVDE